MTMIAELELDGRSLTPAAVHAVAHGARVRLSGDARARCDRTAAIWAGLPSVLVRKHRFLVGEAAPPGAELVAPFLLAHCSGVGEPLPQPIVRAMIVSRANALAHGSSGVRSVVIDALLHLLNEQKTPVVPSQGSVGAAGDLAPLAHVARVIAGLGGAVEDAAGRPCAPPNALHLTDKEALALINGATLTVGLAAVAVTRAARLLDAAEVACAMTMEVLRADLRCISPGAMAARPHPGAVAVAARLRGLLEGSTLARCGERSDPFSLRAAPAVLGAARDALAHTAETVTHELNAACDNPLWVDGEGEVEAGNFHGAPVAVVLDYLRIALTQAATQSERRSFRLTHGALNGDLPSFLVEGTGLNSGFMLAQYTAASLASECKGLSHPASVDTIPTIQHFEDHVSMGPIAGRLTLRVIENLADIVGIEVLLAAQALEFRREGVSFPGGQRSVGPAVALAPAIERARALVRATTAVWRDDQILHPALAATGRLVRGGSLGGDADAAW